MPKTETACPTCREIHEPRGLVYDGKGINSCGMYRARIATFRPDAPEHLGPLFAAAHPVTRLGPRHAPDDMNCASE